MRRANTIRRRRVIPAWAGNSATACTTAARVPGHPRVGGEQSRLRKPYSNSRGSSPRGRGTAEKVVGEHEVDRVIPAWAGNRWSPIASSIVAPGHPRVGGEQADSWAAIASIHGSSPRGRGTGRSADHVEGGARVIPAWAGNRIHAGSPKTVLAGHPRVGGEQGFAPRILLAPGGSSPRGRGTGRDRQAPRHDHRVIPAWAGNRLDTLTVRPASAGHPRVGGEQLRRSAAAAVTPGSSPRGRGTEHGLDQPFLQVRVIPAWAGNSNWYDSRSPHRSGHPRVGGEQFSAAISAAAGFGSSPRGRGTVAVARVAVLAARVIPAWAGNRGQA